MPQLCDMVLQAASAVRIAFFPQFLFGVLQVRNDAVQRGHDNIVARSEHTVQHSAARFRFCRSALFVYRAIVTLEIVDQPFDQLLFCHTVAPFRSVSYPLGVIGLICSTKSRSAPHRPHHIVLICPWLRGVRLGITMRWLQTVQYSSPYTRLFLPVFGCSSHSSMMSLYCSAISLADRFSPSGSPTLN